MKMSQIVKVDQRKGINMVDFMVPINALGYESRAWWGLCVLRGSVSWQLWNRSVMFQSVNSIYLETKTKCSLVFSNISSTSETTKKLRKTLLFLKGTSTERRKSYCYKAFFKPAWYNKSKYNKKNIYISTTGRAPTNRWGTHSTRSSPWRRRMRQLKM